ncbi:MAG: hypothetical protein K2N60_07140, partial [Oscillospiraceae bacterium]|nr:hypothetical protein [Oscillospiraceae bacterium]
EYERGLIFMRIKIIFIVIMTALILAVSAAAEVVYFNNNYAEIELRDGTIRSVRTDVTFISQLENDKYIEKVKCTPSLKKFKNITTITLLANEEINLEYLAEMDKLECLDIIYTDGYCGRLETLPELPNLRLLYLEDNYKSCFKLSAEEEYNFDGIERINLYNFKSVDSDSFKYFKNLRAIDFVCLQNDMTYEEKEELTERGIYCSWVKLD